MLDAMFSGKFFLETDKDGVYTNNLYNDVNFILATKVSIGYCLPRFFQLQAI
jgi:hypothetical protein